MRKTEKELRDVVIEEYYQKIHGVVWWCWRFYGKEEWTKMKTPYSEIPFILLSGAVIANWDNSKE